LWRQHEIFFQLVASFLTRTIPVLSAVRNADLVAIATFFGFAFYLNHDDRTLSLCGSTAQNREQKVRGDLSDCFAVSKATFDPGLSDWNLDTALRSFTIHRHAAWQMQNKSTLIQARDIDGHSVLEVKVCAETEGR
jgi:hypothetical protein